MNSVHALVCLHCIVSIVQHVHGLFSGVVHVRTIHHGYGSVMHVAIAARKGVQTTASTTYCTNLSQYCACPSQSLCLQVASLVPVLHPRTEVWIAPLPPCARGYPPRTWGGEVAEHPLRAEGAWTALRWFLLRPDSGLTRFGPAPRRLQVISRIVSVGP